jgi:hypothetical protein
LRGAEEAQKYAGALGENDIKRTQERQTRLLHWAFIPLKTRCAI